MPANITEFFKIICRNNNQSNINHTEFHGRFLAKTVAEAKKKTWSNFSTNKKFQRPPSILLLGLSSLSKDQARHYLPKSHNFLTQDLGFLAYNRYVRSGDGIIENLFTMLTGVNFQEYHRKAVASKKNREPCKDIIIDAFNQLKYVTFGVIQEYFYNAPLLVRLPTDYTINALLEAYNLEMSKQVI